MKQRNVSRRKFLKILGTFFFSLVFIPLYFESKCFAFMGGANRKSVEAMRSEFPYLDIPSETVLKFINDYKKFYRADLYFPLTEHSRKIFLLSTDFVQNGCSIKEVSYKMFYSPHDHICYNPFSLRSEILNKKLENKTDSFWEA